MNRAYLVSSRRWLIMIALAAAAFFILIWQLTALPAEGTIARNVFIGDVPIGGLTVPEAEELVEARLREIEESGWIFSYQGKSAVVKPILPPSFELGLPEQNLADIDAAVTARRADALGRAWRFSLRQPKIVVPAFVTIREKAVVDTINANFSNLETSPTDPSFVIDKDSGELTVLPESSGQRLDSRAVIKAIQDALERLESPSVTLTVISEPPNVTAVEARSLLPKVKKALARLPLSLKFENQSWPLGDKELLPYLIAVKQDGALALGLRAGFRGAVMEQISREVSRPASPARFKMENNKVTLWQPPLDGRELDIEATLALLNDYLNDETASQKSLDLVINIEAAPSLDGQGRDLGIREIIGIGTSNFKGSPKNRRHNIKVGADTLNGILIAPDEEFSLVTALGEIDASTGYLPELVIKGNRTIPEYGGGLCQIGTTTFRAALASGLPILERQNHSYRVIYYEPAGTDATIYDPKPDFRFLNDTGHSILIQTKIIGDDLIFEFWGTKDGRQVTQTTPRIYNIVKPPPKKIIETTELPEGKEKCTEKAHSGADAEFTYTVVYPNGEKKEKVFKSHYRPWQEVCLLGVKELTASPGAAGGAAGEGGKEGKEEVGADLPAVVTP